MSKNEHALGISSNSDFSLEKSAPISSPPDPPLLSTDQLSVAVTHNYMSEYDFCLSIAQLLGRDTKSGSRDPTCNDSFTIAVACTSENEAATSAILTNLDLLVQSPVHDAARETATAWIAKVSAFFYHLNAYIFSVTIIFLIWKLIHFKNIFIFICERRYILGAKGRQIFSPDGCTTGLVIRHWHWQRYEHQSLIK